MSFTREKKGKKKQTKMMQQLNHQEMKKTLIVLLFSFLVFEKSMIQARKQNGARLKMHPEMKSNEKTENKWHAK